MSVIVNGSGIMSWELVFEYIVVIRRIIDIKDELCLDRYKVVSMFGFMLSLKNGNNPFYNKEMKGSDNNLPAI